MCNSARQARFFCDISNKQLAEASKVFCVLSDTDSLCYASDDANKNEPEEKPVKSIACFVSAHSSLFAPSREELSVLWIHVGPFARGGHAFHGLICPRLPDTVKEWAQLETFLSRIETAQFPKADCVLQFCSRYRLSLREREVLRSCVTGANNDEIASLLKCSRSTISTYWNRIFKKLGVGSVKEVLLRMMEVQDVRSCPTGYTFEVEASSVMQRE